MDLNPTPGVRNAIAECHKIGIRIFMVTGDHLITAKSIATDVGLIQDPSFIIEREDLRKMPSSSYDSIRQRSIVLHGEALPTLSTVDWLKVGAVVPGTLFLHGRRRCRGMKLVCGTS